MSEYRKLDFYQALREHRGVISHLGETSVGKACIPVVRWIASEQLSLQSYGRGDMPLSVGVETFVVCNRRCKYCPEKYPDFIGTRGVVQMSENLFNSILADLHGFPTRDGSGFNGTLHLNGYGEPLLDRRMVGFVTKARHSLPNATIGFYSNGDYLTEDLYDALVTAGINEILMTPHDGQFSSAIQNLASTHEHDQILHLLPPLKTFANRGGLVQVDKDKLQKPHKRCIHPTYTLEIATDGRVLYCAHDAAISAPMGDASKAHLLDIWHNPDYVLLRQNLRHGRLDQMPRVCKACRGE